MKRSTLGMTLPELLVVVAVMSLLISLLFPAMKSVLAAGKSARCIANLRQLGQGVVSYAGDNNNLIVPGVLVDSQGTWEDGLAPYLGLQKANPHGYGVRPEGIFKCPAATNLISPGWKSDYGKNDLVNGDGTSATLRINSLAAPVSLIAIADGKYRDLGTPTSTYGPDVRHQRGANVLYFDWHVESVQPTNLPTDRNKLPWSPK